MLDFTNCPMRKKTYAGANGSKISVLYDGQQYMLKFPSAPSINKEISYANGCISEYLGCHIFNSIGIPVQETLLGTYTKDNKKKVVVACKDFTANGLTLQDFASLKNTIIDSIYNGYGTELSDILQTIDEQNAIDSHLLSNWFWDMFIVDALIGNWDRHNGNWGFLYNNQTDEISFAPIYDCGSCLYPQADAEIMKRTLEDPNEMNLRIFERPLSGIKVNGQKIQYFNFISSLQNKDCNKALKRILPKINLAEIYEIIESTPFISDLQKLFYKTMIRERKERILDFSYRKLIRREKSKEQSR